MPRTFSAAFVVAETEADRVVSFELDRELGRPAVAVVDVVYSQDVTPLEAVGSAAMLRFGYEGEPAHELFGVIESVSQEGTPLVGGSTEGGSSAHRARFRLVSIVAFLEGNNDARIFQDKDVKDIVTTVLEEHGLPANRQKWQLSGSYPKREYCVQYLETTLAFVSRLLEEEGIYFRSASEDGEEVVELSDDSPSAAPIDGDAALSFRGKTGLSTASDAVVAVVERAELVAGKVTLRDYDFKRPSLDMTVDAEGEAETDLERYDFPGLYVEPSEGKRLARVRLEAERARRETVSILADCPRLDAGRIVELSDVPHDDLAGKFLIPRVRHLYGA
ncbi:MAG TPA: type VI secretion system tip protein TssI/VgrG, partial [Polyangiaceae bacterium]|nr:type VI secretion system tip protein TssI/VgrG [Polyangiaceae bacterium]